MLVSIISVAYNSGATIAKTIESVMCQTYPNIEYIIVDGSSSDNTAEIAKSYKKRFENTENRTMTIISEPDNGMYDALNKGIRLAHGELIGSINTDDRYEPDAVSTMVRLYEKEKYDAAWGDLRIVKENGCYIKKAKLGKLWTTTGWCHPSMFATREILTKFPYACETMYDDFDFITRVHLSGGKICVINEVIANFTVGGMSTQKSLREVKRRIDITYGIYKKYGMSKFYYLHRVMFELVKYVFG